MRYLLPEIREEKDIQLKELTQQVVTLQVEIKCLSAKFHSNNVSSKDQNTQTVPSHVKTTIASFAGDSIPAENKPLHVGAEVIGLPGSTIKSLMEQLKSKGKDYGRLVLLVGANDCASTQTIEEITESYYCITPWASYSLCTMSQERQ